MSGILALSDAAMDPKSDLHRIVCHQRHVELAAEACIASLKLIGMNVVSEAAVSDADKIRRQLSNAVLRAVMGSGAVGRVKHQGRWWAPSRAIKCALLGKGGFRSRRDQRRVRLDGGGWTAGRRRGRQPETRQDVRHPQGVDTSKLRNTPRRRVETPLAGGSKHPSPASAIPKGRIGGVLGGEGIGGSGFLFVIADNVRLLYLNKPKLAKT